MVEFGIIISFLLQLTVIFAGGFIKDGIILLWLLVIICVCIIGNPQPSLICQTRNLIHSWSFGDLLMSGARPWLPHGVSVTNLQSKTKDFGYNLQLYRRSLISKSRADGIFHFNGVRVATSHPQSEAGINRKIEKPIIESKSKLSWVLKETNWKRAAFRKGINSIDAFFCMEWRKESPSGSNEYELLHQWSQVECVKI